MCGFVQTRFVMSVRALAPARDGTEHHRDRGAALMCGIVAVACARVDSRVPGGAR